MSQMYDEVRQQPAVIARLVASEKVNTFNFAKEIRKRGIDFVVMAARGTSDHSAIYGKYLLEINNAMPVGLADPSVVTLYSGELKLRNALVVGVSQSGESTDVDEFLARSKEAGALTLGITNEPGSTITKIADHTILCHAGKELAVAATKTYTSSLAAFYLLSAGLSEAEEKVDKLLACADVMQEVLALDGYLSDRAERYRYAGAGVVLSRGMNLCTALEMALKLSETCYLRMRGFSAADFMHGPIAAVHADDPCFLLAPAGNTYESMLQMSERLRDREADTFIVSSEDEILKCATVPVKMPREIDEELSPLVYIIPGQLFSNYVSIIRGNDPDHPKGLNKVTLTR